MNVKERFTATLRFEETDRPFFMPSIGFWKETLDRWYGEGLPKYVINELVAVLYFNYDYWVPIPVGTHEQPGFFPPFARKTIEKGENWRIVRDGAGKVFKEFTDGSSSVPLFLEAPVKNMDDFRQLRWRLRPNMPGRAINPAWDIMNSFCAKQGLPLVVQFSGLFGFHRHLLGDEELMLAYYDMPDVIHAMSKAWVRLTRGTLRRMTKRYDITMVAFWEDMCFRNGPLISPKTFREFMTPYYREVIDDARENGIEFFQVDTDGDCTLVIPLFEEVGVNMLLPFEVQAGMDILKVREDHPKTAIFGGLDKRVLAETKDDIEEEVMSKVPAMLEQGGYFPAIDHAVPPDVSLKNFKFFLWLLKSRKVNVR